MKKNIGAVLSEALGSLFKKPATSEYPKKKREIHKSYAGMISFEQDKCIGCQICVRNCPANAIKITKVADKVFSCELSLANCIFCSQCVLSCPKKALHTTDSFELAQTDKSKLTVKREDLAPKKEKQAEPAAQQPVIQENAPVKEAVAEEKNVPQAPQQAASAPVSAKAEPNKPQQQTLNIDSDPAQTKK